MKKNHNKFLEVLSVLENSGFSGTIFFIAYKIKLFFLASWLIRRSNSTVSIDLIGCGNYALSRHIPIFITQKLKIGSIDTKSGLAAKKLNLPRSLTRNKHSNYLLICSPHNMHPEHLIENVNKYQKVYCEKPVCIDRKGLNILKQFLDNFPTADSKVTVGFNRRNAPAVLQIMKSIQRGNSKIELTYRVNFGTRVSNDMSDIKIGGGRLIGACCHYVDLIEYIIGSKILNIYARPLQQDDHDTFSAIFGFKDGSLATLIFSSEGIRPKVGKEQISITTKDLSVDLLDFRRLNINGKIYNYRGGLDGSRITWKKFISNSEFDSQISLSEGMHATEVTLAIRESLNNNEKVSLL